MKSHTRTWTLAGLCLYTLSVFGQPAADQRVEITGATVNYLTNRLFITGQNFVARSPLVVTLGGQALATDAAQPPTATLIAAILPAALSPGTYPLVVSNGNGAVDTATVDVTLGIAGPAGAIGPQGPTGPAGPIGPQGSPGATGIQARGVDANEVAMRGRDDTNRLMNITWTWIGTTRVEGPVDLGTIQVCSAGSPDSAISTPYRYVSQTSSPLGPTALVGFVRGTTYP